MKKSIKGSGTVKWDIFAVIVKSFAVFAVRCVASDNSWFWIYKKQATGVSILHDTVKFEADIVS